MTSLTVSAAMRNRSSLLRNASSARRRSVMSRAILAAPIIAPAESRIGETVRDHIASAPYRLLKKALGPITYIICDGGRAIAHPSCASLALDISYSFAAAVGGAFL